MHYYVNFYIQFLPDMSTISDTTTIVFYHDDGTVDGDAKEVTQNKHLSSWAGWQSKEQANN